MRFDAYLAHPDRPRLVAARAAAAVHLTNEGSP